jgi:hypothetical protein
MKIACLKAHHSVKKCLLDILLLLLAVLDELPDVLEDLVKVFVRKCFLLVTHRLPHTLKYIDYPPATLFDRCPSGIDGRSIVAGVLDQICVLGIHEPDYRKLMNLGISLLFDLGINDRLVAFGLKLGFEYSNVLIFLFQQLLKVSKELTTIMRSQKIRYTHVIKN